MKDCKFGRIPPCYSGRVFNIYEEAKKVKHEWDKTQELWGAVIDKIRAKLMEGGFFDDIYHKVYGVNDPLDPPSEETMEKVADTLEPHLKTMRELNRKSKLPIEVTEEHIKIINRLMEEKKTKKMTKAEAFEYLKGKKVLCRYYDKMEAVQGFVKSLGFHWSDYSEEPMLASILFLGEDERLTFSVSLKRFEEHEYEEISADDILSIEIVEGTPKFSYEKVVELAKPLMEYLNDTGCSEQIGVSYDHIVAQPMATFLHGEMKGC